MIIDLHTHLFPAKAFKEARRKYVENLPTVIKDPRQKFFLLVSGKAYGPITEELFDLRKRIKVMKKGGTDLQLLSVVPHTFSYDVEPQLGLALARVQNDAVSEVVNSYPDEFMGAATVPLQDVDLAIEELDRAVNDLGMRSVEIGSNVRGENLDSIELWRFYEKVQNLNIPILVHPTRPANAERMKKYYLTNIIGHPLETSLAAASIILGGVLDRFQNLKFCFAHGGGFIPYQRGRLEHGYEVRSEAKVVISKPPSHYLDLLFFDTITHFQPALCYLVATIGCDKVVLGTDFPFDMGDPYMVSSIKKLDGLSKEEKEKILGGNAAKLLRVA